MALGVASTAAKADLIMEITSGGSTVRLVDGAGLDALDGFVGYMGSIGAWEMTVGMASAAYDPFSMHLTAGVSGTPGDGPITIRVTQTGLQAGANPLTPFWAGGSGTTSAPLSVASWSAWVDDQNREFGQGELVESTSGYNGDERSIAAALSGFYSATIITTFSYAGVPGTTGRFGSSLDVSMRVPEPTSLALVGLGLLGAGIARRRQAKA